MHHEALDAFALAFASRKSVSAFTEDSLLFASIHCDIICVDVTA